MILENKSNMNVKELIDVIRPDECVKCNGEFKIKYEAKDYLCFECDCKSHVFIEKTLNIEEVTYV